MLELAFKIHGQIVDFWKFFVPSTVVLLGWIFARKAPWLWSQRMAVAVAFSGFAIFNLNGLIGSYELLETLVAELRGTGAAPGLSAEAFNAVVSRLDLGWSWKLGIIFHIVIDIGVLYFLLIESGKSNVP